MNILIEMPSSRYRWSFW